MGKSNDQRTSQGTSQHPGQRWRVVAVGVAVLVIVLVAAALILQRRGNAPGAFSEPSVDSLVAGGPQASATAGGLTYTVRLSPGPYFLSEFTVAQLTLSNGGRQSYQITGRVTSANFNQALYVTLTGGSGPTYALPLPSAPRSFPPPDINTLAPGQTWSETLYLPLTRSGEVVLSAKALFTTAKQDGHGGDVISYNDGPFAGHLPSLRLSIAPTVPVGHMLTLAIGSTGGMSSVMVTGPTGVLGRVYYLRAATCGSYPSPGSTAEMPGGWLWLQGTTLTEPSCPGPNEVWAYAFATPGYAIRTGTIPSR